MPTTSRLIRCFTRTCAAVGKEVPLGFSARIIQLLKSLDSLFSAAGGIFSCGRWTWRAFDHERFRKGGSVRTGAHPVFYALILFEQKMAKIIT